MLWISSEYKAEYKGNVKELLWKYIANHNVNAQNFSKRKNDFRKYKVKYRGNATVLQENTQQNPVPRWKENRPSAGDKNVNTLSSIQSMELLEFGTQGVQKSETC